MFIVNLESITFMKLKIIVKATLFYLTHSEDVQCHSGVYHIYEG